MAKEHYTKVMNLILLFSIISYKTFESSMIDSHKVMSIYLFIFEEKSQLEKELEFFKKENQFLKDDIDSLKI